MKRILEFTKKNLILIVVMVAVGIPVIIYGLSVIPVFPSGLNNDWAGFWGGYIGAIVGGMCTVIGVFWTIQYSRENYKEDVRNRSLPYIALTTLQSDRTVDLLNFESGYYNNSFEEDCNELVKYKEYRLEKLFIVLDKGEIEYKKHLSDEQNQLIKTGGIVETKKQNGKTISDKGILSIPFEIENVGNGAALTFRVGLNREGEEDSKYILPLNLKIGDKVYIHIFSEDNIKNNLNIGKYILELYYEDIFSNQYRQKYKLIIERQEGKRNVTSLLDLSGKQELI